MSDRQRLYKKRKRLGYRVFRIPAHVAELSEALIEAGFLAWDKAEDFTSIERALVEVVRELTEGDVSPSLYRGRAKSGSNQED